MDIICKKGTSALWAILCFSLPLSLNAQDECFEPDHLLSYELDLIGTWTPIIDVEITGDQFLDLVTTPGDFTINEPDRLLVPATKFHNGKRHRPNHPSTHFISAPVIFISDDDDPLLPPSIVAGRFRFINQFSDFNLVTGDVPPEDDDATIIIDETTGLPTFSLLIPSAKCVCPENSIKEGTKQCSCPPFLEDHYLCYDISPGEEACPEDDEEFRVDDQFRRNRLTELGNAVRVCNPVAKTNPLTGDVSDFEDTASNHLVCYTINERSLNPARLVNLFNQFSEQDGIVQINNEFCVPSIKVPVDFVAGLRAFMTEAVYDGNLVLAAQGMPEDPDLPQCIGTDFNPATAGTIGNGCAGTPGNCGVLAADCLCQNAAFNASTPLTCEGGGFGCWKAWISDSSSASQPNSRFNIAGTDIPIYEVNDVNGGIDLNAPIATGGYVDLVACAGGICLDDPAIGPASWKDENGIRSDTAPFDVWTNSLFNGNRTGVGGNCLNWRDNTNPVLTGAAGLTNDPTILWTDSPAIVSCLSEAQRIYCFEDTP